MEVLFHLLIGPLLLVISLIYYFFPPKKINSLYGYRTPRSMKNLDNWNYANKYSSRGILIVSVITIASQGFFEIALNDTGVAILAGTSVMILGLFYMIYDTEKQLKKRDGE